MAARPGRPKAGGPRERRPAIWPWLVMPVIVLLVFYALYRVHEPRHHAAAPAPAAAPPVGTGGQASLPGSIGAGAAAPLA